jgi:hypothetical protein
VLLTNFRKVGCLLEDLRLLEELEDQSDIKAAREALAESDERIPYEEIREGWAANVRDKSTELFTR